MPIKPLEVGKLRRVSANGHFAFETTAELPTVDTIIGQPRGTRAIEFGIGMQSRGYNVFVLGEPGTGRTTAIRRFLQQNTKHEPPPSDWVYVHNFTIPHQPRALPLPAGRGAAFRDDVATLQQRLRQELPGAFATEAYHDAVAAIEQEIRDLQEKHLDAVEEASAAAGCTVLRTASGPVIAPVDNGRLVPPDVVAALPLDVRRPLEEQLEALAGDLEKALYHVRRLDIARQERLHDLNREVAAKAIGHHFDYWEEAYGDLPAVRGYLEAMRQDIVDHVEDFLDAVDANSRGLRRYDVNLFVSHAPDTGAPVVVERNPTHQNLVGRVEHRIEQGVMTPHFTTLKAGALHRANGGYLILDAPALRRQRDAWEALKQAIETEEIHLAPPGSADGMPAMAESLEPEPIPLRVKVILLGSIDHYYSLFDREENFGELFKVKADFDSVMPRDETHELEYAQFIANRCREEGLRHFTRAAVQKVVEFGSRLCEEQERLSTRFGVIADVVREANYWAAAGERDVVSADDVQQALQERAYRSSRIEEDMREQILTGDVLIATEGTVVGQVNALFVLDMGDYAFGQPGRITARTYMGEDGVINIEREVDMAGPIHNKGLMTLIGYLGGTYAQRQPLSLSASLTFEQNYAEIDGDSASAGELYALLSSLSGLPVQQSIAVTGSINQQGQMQPVGGVTEKVEGFFAVCKARGLTGKQGVVLPAANVTNLMVSEEVIAAVSAGQFNVWAVNTVDEGMELLLGKAAGAPDRNGRYPQGTVHHAVQTTLRRLALDLKSFGEPDEPEEAG